MSDLLVLVGRNVNKGGLVENVHSEGGVGQLHDVIGPDQVKSGLIFVHRVQDGQAVLV